MRGGYRAMHPGICRTCGYTYSVGDFIAPHRGSYVHQACAPGGDDE